MAEIKANKKVIDEQIKKIINNSINCLMGNKFKKIILGVIVDQNNDNYFSEELFYLDDDNKYVYVNKVSWEEKTNFELDDLIDILQQSISEIIDYCYKYGDKWDCMTIEIKENGKFNISFSYEPVDFRKWIEINKISL